MLGDGAGACRGPTAGPRGRRAAARFPDSLLPMTSQHSLETDSHRFSVSLSHCFAAIGRSVVLFCFVLRCHVLPCSSFNFLIEKCIKGAFFFVDFFYVINFDLM